jgi:methanogenic corrinoid protein MtbC1
MADNDRVRAALIDDILKGQRISAAGLLQQYSSAHGYRRAVKEILEPVLAEIGDRWSRGNLSLAQGYVAGKVAEDFLLNIDDARDDRPGSTPRKGPVVIGNVEDDFHALGRKLLSVFLQSSRWKVVDLGNDVAARDFVDKAVEVGARVIGVSAMMFATAENIRAIREELDTRSLSGSIQLAVGGAVFTIRPELVLEVGGDGSVSNAMSAPQLFEELWERSCRVNRQ